MTNPEIDFLRSTILTMALRGTSMEYPFKALCEKAKEANNKHVYSLTYFNVDHYAWIEDGIFSSEEKAREYLAREFPHITNEDDIIIDRIVINSNL